ncbi:MAG TPA: universal stress protein [Thermomicrobiales bacterium]|nr:universal stress protein [Thermomicrobiales bacterium]
MPGASDLAPVLVPFDGSLLAEAALPFAAALAGAGGSIVLLQAVPAPQPIRDVLGDVVLTADHLLYLTRDAAAADLDRAEALLRLQDPTLAVDREVAVGDAAGVIVEAAGERRARLVVVTSRGRGGTVAGHLGSVAHRLTEAAPVPLLLVPSESQPHGGGVPRLVFGHDGSDHALAALALAGEVARRHAAPVHLVGVVEAGLPEVPPLDRREMLEDRVADGLFADARRDAQRTVEGAGAHLLRQGVHASWETVDGDPATELMARCRPGDILVIASHGRNGATRWGLGSVARRLLQRSPLPTLLVRTAPVESPVAAIQPEADGPPVA